MREIKFRGRRKHGKKKGWVYGNLRIVGDYVGIETPTINPPDAADTEVDPETVGQYTGFKDKNGIEIFEGDVVETGGGRGFVFWKESSACFGIKWLGGKGDLLADICEVAGNIHDSPELLEKEK